MDLASVSFYGLAIVVAASCFSRGNPGVIAFAMTWLLGAVIAPRFGAAIPNKEILAGFPTDMFLTLLGVSLLFAQSEVNGTLGLVAYHAERLCRGNVMLMPILFCLLAFGIGSLGPGNIAAAGLLAPVAMKSASRLGLPPLLMALCLGHGAIASTLTPFSAAGIVANRMIADMGQPDRPWLVFAGNAIANLLVAGLIHIGFQLFHKPNPLTAETGTGQGEASHPRFERVHGLTLAVITLLLVAVVLGWAPLGMGAFCAAAILFSLGAAEERSSMHRVPWSVIVAVCGIGMLSGLMEKTGGTAKFAELLRSVSTPETIVPLLAFGTGIVSIYSSTTGVVLPAFLPMVGKLIEHYPGVEPMALANAVLIGGNLVDVSPLSTIGALCLASMPETPERKRLFRQLMVFGFVNAFLGAAICAALARFGSG